MRLRPEDVALKLMKFCKDTVSGLLVPYQGLTTSGYYIDINSPNNGDIVTLDSTGKFFATGTIKPTSMSAAPPMNAWLEDAAGIKVAGTWVPTGNSTWKFSFSGIPVGLLGEWVTLTVAAKNPLAHPAINLANSLSVMPSQA